MERNPAISIVLPTFNGAKYISGAVNAILRQTHTDWELVVVDDASTDATSEILAGFARRDSRIRLIRNDHNRKLPASLNIGFKASRGKYLTWTSDDNWHREHALKTLAEFLDTHPAIGLVYSDYTTVDANGDEMDTVVASDQWLLPFGNCVGASFLYRRDVYERLGDYAEDLFLAEDFDYWLRLASNFHLAALHRDLYCYRLHENSLTSQRIRQIRVAHGRALLINIPNIPWLTASGRAVAYLELAHQARLSCARLSVLHLVLRSLLSHPGVLIARRIWRPEDVVVTADGDRLSAEERAYLSWLITRRGAVSRLLLYALFGDLPARALWYLWARLPACVKRKNLLSDAP